jgi:carbonic anhydrase/acetyltransferase-like protein (isoleucine patch superfamily)
MKKYKLGEKEHGLYRIIALRDFGNVKKGDKGGLIWSEDNLSHDGNCWVYENAEVSENAWVYGDARVSENAWVFGNARVYGNARVSGDAGVYGNARVYGIAWVRGEALVSGKALVSGSSRVSGKNIVTKRTVSIVGLPRNYITVTDNHVNIGCKQHTLEFWLDNYKEIGRESGFSETEIEIYKYQLEGIKKYDL